MGSTAQILRPQKTIMTEEERVSDFLEIISPLGFRTKVSEYDRSVYMQPEIDSEKGVNVWVD